MVGLRPATAQFNVGQAAMKEAYMDSVLGLRSSGRC
jgi:hypothetical protein